MLILLDTEELFFGEYSYYLNQVPADTRSSTKTTHQLKDLKTSEKKIKVYLKFLKVAWKVLGGAFSQ